MPKAVLAIFENGLLKPSEKLPLEDKQKVWVVIVPMQAEVDTARLKALREQAEDWLRQQPPNTVREPIELAPELEKRLDDEFEQTLARIHARASRYSEAVIIADIEAAIAEVRALSDDERRLLDAEFDKILAQIAFDGAT